MSLVNVGMTSEATRVWLVRGIPLPGEFAKGGIIELEAHAGADFSQQVEGIEFAAAQDGEDRPSGRSRPGICNNA